MGQRKGFTLHAVNADTQGMQFAPIIGGGIAEECEFGVHR